MAKMREKAYNFLRGSFLVDEDAFKNWRFIIFVVTLLLVMVFSGHKIHKKVYRLSSLGEEVRELKAEYIDMGTILTRMKMESAIREKVKEKGLVSSKAPAVKIVVTSKKDSH